MPVTFKSQAAADLVMLNASAEALLGMIGKTASEPGILEPKDMAAALATLQAASHDAETGSEPAEPRALPVDKLAGEQDDEPVARETAFADEPVTLRQRAWPLIRMIERAMAENRPIVWGV
jgi:hypothetical protein